ncbi:unnamed protein product, partial [Polarella glacialis]
VDRRRKSSAVLAVLTVAAVSSAALARRAYAEVSFVAPRTRFGETSRPGCRGRAVGGRRASGEAGAADSDFEGRVVILGAGLQGAALAYFLTLRGVKPVVVEREKVAAAASGKGGGFLARDWGDAITRQLHRVSFKLHEELAETLGIQSYRRLPVLSVSPGQRSSRTRDICPWLDGEISDTQIMDSDGGAQVAPLELCTKLMEAAIANGAELRIGTAQGVELEPSGDIERVTGVLVDGSVIPADKVCVCLGPWAALAQDWFDLPVPMTGVKSSSIVFKSSEPVEPF